MTEKIKNKNEMINIALISIAVLLVIFVLWYLNFYLLKGKNPTERGTFGDMFRVVNSVFSGLAFAGILISLIFQWVQLKSQNNDIAISMKIQEKSATALERQAENLKKTAILYALQAKLNFYTIERNKNEKLLTTTSHITDNHVNAYFYEKEISKCLAEINKILDEKIDQ